MGTIAIDCRFAGGSSGLGRYTRELTEHLVQDRRTHTFVLLVRPDGRAWASRLPPTLSLRIRTTDIPHYSLREHMLLPRVLTQERVDLLFSPHFNVPLRWPVPFVATVHDLILHRFPNAAGLPRRLAYRALMYHTVHAASALVTVSTFVRTELEECYGCTIARKAAVIAEGVSPAFTRRSAEEQERVCRACGIQRPFFLYVGNAKEHKNIPFLLQAFQAAQLAVSSLVLVAGGREAQRLHLPRGVVRIPWVADDDLPALYSAASAFVTASLYEGYCLPVVEALASGCPVIAPRTGPFPEVTRGQACLVQPVLEAFVGALRSPPPPPVSFERPSWADAASATMDTLCDVLQDR